MLDGKILIAILKKSGLTAPAGVSLRHLVCPGPDDDGTPTMVRAQCYDAGVQYLFDTILQRHEKNASRTDVTRIVERIHAIPAEELIEIGMEDLEVVTV